MKWSKYNFIFQSEKHGNLLYNSLSNCFVQLNQDTFDQLSQFKEKGTIENVSDDVPTEFMEQLKRSKIVVESDYDEYLRIKGTRQVNRNRDESLSLTIAPTLHCNFNCPYCFEASRPSVYMTQEVENKLLDFIKGFSLVKNIDVSWFGGEPLMAWDKIKSITKGILELNKDYSAGIITNGFLLDKAKIDLLGELKINFVQITLDGPEATHNKRRPLLNDKGTFNKIIKNLDSLAERQGDFNLAISIRVNIDGTNKNDFAELFYYMKNRYPNNNIHVYPGYVAELGEGCSSNGDTHLDREQQASFMKEQFINHGITAFEFFPRHVDHECMARQKNGYLIGARGEIYKCWMDLGVKDKMVGHLMDDTISNNKVLNKYLYGVDQFDDGACQSCMLLPVCGAGCPKYKINSIDTGAKYDHCHVAKGNLKEFLEIHYDIRSNMKEGEKLVKNQTFI